MPTRTGGMTVMIAAPDMSPDVAVMVVAPVATALARPWDPEVFDTVPVPVSDDDHVTESVMFWVGPVRYVPVAVNCWVSPAATDAVAGVTLMLRRTAASARWLVRGSMTPMATPVTRTSGT